MDIWGEGYLPSMKKIGRPVIFSPYAQREVTCSKPALFSLRVAAELLPARASKHNVNLEMDIIFEFEKKEEDYTKNQRLLMKSSEPLPIWKPHGLSTNPKTGGRDLYSSFSLCVIN